VRLGARRALGLGARAQTIAPAARAELREVAFENWQAEEAFDVVLCDRLQEMLDPIHALQRMMSIAREKIVLEIPARSPEHDDTPTISIEPKALFGDRKRIYLFSPQAIGVLLNEHSHAFEPIAVSTSPNDKRLVIEAKRRRIKHLTVIAGPSASGKTHLLRKLRKDDLLRQRLGIAPDWLGMGENKLAEKLPRGEIEHFVLHYNILRPFDGMARTYETDPATSLFSCADKITFLTLTATIARLQAQVDRRLKKRDKPSLRAVRILYEDERFLRTWYDRWLQFVARFEGVTAGNYRLSPYDGHELTPVGPGSSIR
jgi:hypothetical protein